MTPAQYKSTRERLGTQAEVARLLGVNRVTVAKRENGTMTITNEAVLAIQSLRRPRGKRIARRSNVPAVPARNELGTSAEFWPVLTAKNNFIFPLALV